MKILSIITTIIFIGYIFCATEPQIFDIKLSSKINIEQSSLPEGVLLKDTQLYFRFQKEAKPILIHLILPEGVKNEEILLSYHGFEEQPSDQDIYDASEEFTDVELYDEVEYERDGKELTYLMDNEIPYITLSFTTLADLTSLGILVENYEEGKEDDKDKESIYDMNIYDVEFSTTYDINLKQTGEYYYFGLNSTQEHTGDIILNLILPHGSSNFFVYGYQLKNGKIEELASLDQTSDQLEITELKSGEDETSDIHRYKFTLNEDKKYFLILVSMVTPLENIKVYLSEKKEGEDEEEEKEEKEESHTDNADNVYIVTYSNEIEIDQEYLKANKTDYSFVLISQNPLKGDVFVQFKVKKGLKESPLSLLALARKNILIEDEEDRLDVDIKLKGITEGEEYDIYEYNFKLDEELYFIIAVMINEDLDYLSVYLPANSTEPDTTEPDTTEPDTTEPDTTEPDTTEPVPHGEDEEHIYEFDYLELYNINTTDENAKNFFWPKEKDNNGEYLLNVIVPHSDSEKEVFDIIGFQLKDSESPKEEAAEMEVTFIKKLENIEDSTKDLYQYSFTLDEGNKYYMILIQLFEKVDQLSYLCYFREKEYKVKYSTEYVIEKKYLIKSEVPFNTFLSTEPYAGDNYIKLKVKKGVKEDSFTFEGTALKEYDTNNTNGEVVEIEYKDTLPGVEYDTLEYHFKTVENLEYFVIKMILNDPLDYLTIMFENKTEKNETKPDKPIPPEEPEKPGDKESQKTESDNSLSPIVLAIIIIVTALILLIVIYFVCRKCGCLKKSDVTSKDIENVDQIIV